MESDIGELSHTDVEVNPHGSKLSCCLCPREPQISPNGIHPASHFSQSPSAPSTRTRKSEPFWLAKRERNRFDHRPQVKQPTSQATAKGGSGRVGIRTPAREGRAPCESHSVVRTPERPSVYLSCDRRPLSDAQYRISALAERWDKKKGRLSEREREREAGNAKSWRGGVAGAYAGRC